MGPYGGDRGLPAEPRVLPVMWISTPWAETLTLCSVIPRGSAGMEIVVSARLPSADTGRPSAETTLMLILLGPTLVTCAVALPETIPRSTAIFTSSLLTAEIFRPGALDAPARLANVISPVPDSRATVAPE